MACMGFPGDEDPLHAAEEHECPECGNILDVSKGCAQCSECEFSHEQDPPEKDYDNCSIYCPYDR